MPDCGTEDVGGASIALICRPRLVPQERPIAGSGQQAAGNKKPRDDQHHGVLKIRGSNQADVVHRIERLIRLLNRSRDVRSGRGFRSRSVGLRGFAAADETEAETESDGGERDTNDVHLIISLLVMIRWDQRLMMPCFIRSGNHSGLFF